MHTQAHIACSMEDERLSSFGFHDSLICRPAKSFESRDHTPAGAVKSSLGDKRATSFVEPCLGKMVTATQKPSGTSTAHSPKVRTLGETLLEERRVPPQVVTKPHGEGVAKRRRQHTKSRRGKRMSSALFSDHPNGPVFDLFTNLTATLMSPGCGNCKLRRVKGRNCH